MSFQRRLLFFIYGMLLFLLLGNLLVGIFNSRLYFYEHLQSLSQDAATSLGLTLSHAAKGGDDAQVRSIVDAMFDSGHYQSIVYSNLESEVVASRAAPIAAFGAPDWFVGMINFATIGGRAEVVSGWYRLGEVHVVSNPEHAYQELWQAFKHKIWLFVFTAVLAYGLVGVLIEAMLRPLRQMEKQVISITKESFDSELQLPKVAEFRTVVVALNTMSKKIHDSFRRQLELIESLRRETHMDALTELPNREDFDARVSAWLASDYGDAPCVLIIASLKNLNEINVRQGRDFTDGLIQEVAEALKALMGKWPDAIIGRRSGADFSVFVSGVYGSEVQTLMSTISTRVEAANTVIPMQTHPLEYGVAIASSRMSVEQLLGAADASMRSARGADASFEVVDLDVDRNLARPAREWLPILENAIQAQSIELFLQAVYIGTYDKPAHYEVLSRIREGEEFISAGVFWSLAERFGLNEDLDRAVVTKVLAYLAKHESLHLSVNLSLKSALSESFIQWLQEALKQSPPQVLGRLTLEIPEHLLRYASSAFQPAISVAHDLNVSISVDRFGLLATSMSRLQESPVNFVKLDRRFTSGITDSSENRLYVRTLVNIALSCGVQLLAEGVESEAEFEALKALGVEGAQGFYFGKPRPAEEIVSRYF